MKKAKLFRNGQSQAVRLPQEFRLPGNEVFIKRCGNAVMLIPTQDSWDSLLSSLDMFSADFMDERQQPKQQKERENLSF